MTGGTDDEKSAYRWSAVALEDLNLSVVAFWDYRFSVMRFMI